MEDDRRYCRVLIREICHKNIITRVTLHFSATCNSYRNCTTAVVPGIFETHQFYSKSRGRSKITLYAVSISLTFRERYLSYMHFVLSSERNKSGL